MLEEKPMIRFSCDNTSVCGNSGYIYVDTKYNVSEARRELVSQGWLLLLSNMMLICPDCITFHISERDSGFYIGIKEPFKTLIKGPIK